MTLSADANRYSPPEMRVLEGINSPIPLVLVTRLEPFTFNEELRKLDKYILCNLAELGWSYDWSRGTPIFGKNFDDFRDLYPGDEWAKFNDWVSVNPPILTFQRELLQKDVWYDIKPIEYPNWQPSFHIESKEKFDSRPIDVTFMWGRSHEIRPYIHSQIWAKSGEMGWNVCDNPNFYNAFMQGESGRKAVTFNLPHYCRIPIEQLLTINGQSKISISAPGSGVKCFRSTGEANVNSIVCMQHDKLAWTYPFIEDQNCIKFQYDPIYEIKLALGNQHLYDIYLAGMETAEKYRWPNYKLHLESLIESVL